MVLEFLGTGVFRLCHRSQLVYNACWEDPRLDRIALQLGSDDHVMVITSGGCNALDYLLEGPRHVHAVDVNWRQNALLELKVAGIRSLDYETFFSLFGRGRLDDWDRVYSEKLRGHLSDRARQYWDNRGWMFAGTRCGRSFYFCGSSGVFARLINFYVDHLGRFRDDVTAIFETSDLRQQREIYLSRIKPQLWGPFIRWLVRRDFALALLGVPRSQRRQIDHQYQGGISQYIEDQMDELFTRIPLRDNYFWRVYATGEYSRTCCPEYLKEEQFARLQSGLIDRLSIHTGSILEFLQETRHQISRFVLLDHMDWLYERHQDVLQKQWQAMSERATPGARLIWRSAAPHVDFVDPLVVQRDGRRLRIGDVLHYDHELAATLHGQDRVHTYGSFYIAQMNLGHDAETPSHNKEEPNHHESRRNAQNSVSSRLLADSR